MKADFEVSVVTIRFVELVENLIYEKRLKSKIELARILGVNKDAISRILNLKQDIPVKLLHKFIIAFEVTPNYLFSSGDLSEKIEVRSSNKTNEEKIREKLRKINKLTEEISIELSK